MLPLILVVVLMILVYVYVVWNNDYWEKRQVPFAVPSFFFGSFKDVAMGRKHFGLMYDELYRKHKHHPYFGYFKLRDPSLMITDPDLIRNILIKDFPSFANNDFQVNAEVDKVWSENIFSQTGEKWKKNRAAWTIGMTSSKLKTIYNNIYVRSDIMIKHLTNVANNKTSMEATKLSSRFFTDVVVSSILEMEINSFENENNPYRKVLDALLTPSFIDNIKTLSFILAPWLAKFINMRFLPEKMEADLIVLAKEIIENRKVRGFQKSNPFDSMLAHGKENTGITDLETAGFLFGFLLDGTETSAGVLGFTLYSLATNMDAQQKLRNEIDEAFENGQDGKIAYDDITKLPYMEMVVSETLRMYTPAMALQKVCTKPYELPSVYKGSSPVKIPVGMPITIPIYSLHMNPAYFPDPEKFDPERFSAENKGTIPKFAYLPFGEGPRACIGTKLAMLQLKVGLATILKNFELRPAPDMIGKPIVIDPNMFILRSLNGLWITFHKRN